jgi:hypothetical protein
MQFVWFCFCCYCSQWGWQQFIRSLLTDCCFLWKLRMPVHPFPLLTLCCTFTCSRLSLPLSIPIFSFGKWIRLPLVELLPSFRLYSCPHNRSLLQVVEPNGPLEFFNTSLYTCHALWPRSRLYNRDLRLVCVVRRLFPWDGQRNLASAELPFSCAWHFSVSRDVSPWHTQDSLKVAG